MILLHIRAFQRSLLSVALLFHARVADDMVDDKPVPDEQDDHGADSRADKTGSLIEPVPADGLANKGGNECADNLQNSCKNKTSRAIRSRRYKTRDEAGDEPDHNDPDNVRHGGVLVVVALN